jgi:hypothetical protein
MPFGAVGVRLPGVGTATVCISPDHNRILECAAAAESDVIVPCDKDLLRPREYGGIEIVRAVEFLERGMEPLPGVLNGCGVSRRSRGNRSLAVTAPIGMPRVCKDLQSRDR